MILLLLRLEAIRVIDFLFLVTLLLLNHTLELLQFSLLFLLFLGLFLLVLDTLLFLVLIRPDGLFVEASLQRVVATVQILLVL